MIYGPNDDAIDAGIFSGRYTSTIVARIWPVAENYTAMVILDNLIAHYGYQTLMERVKK